MMHPIRWGGAFLHQTVAPSFCQTILDACLESPNTHGALNSYDEDEMWFGSQTRQRHSDSQVGAHELNRRLRSENDVLRAQNADLAKELVG